MEENAARYVRVAAGLSARIDGCPADRWSAQSPCPQWTARDVVAHVVEVHRRMVAGLEQAQASPVADDEDVAIAWHAASKAVSAALANPSTASQVVGGRFGQATFEQLVGTLLCADALVHTWDLARASGQDEVLDIEAVRAAHAHLTPLDEMLRVPGGFGPKLEPPAGADEQTRFLCFVGRRG